MGHRVQWTGLRGVCSDTQPFRLTASQTVHWTVRTIGWQPINGNQSEPNSCEKAVSSYYINLIDYILLQS